MHSLSPFPSQRVQPMLLLTPPGTPHCHLPRPWPCSWKMIGQTIAHQIRFRGLEGLDSRTSGAAGVRSVCGGARSCKDTILPLQEPCQSNALLLYFSLQVCFATLCHLLCQQPTRQARQHLSVTGWIAQIPVLACTIRASFLCFALHLSATLPLQEPAPRAGVTTGQISCLLLCTKCTVIRGGGRLDPPLSTIVLDVLKELLSKGAHGPAHVSPP